MPQAPRRPDRDHARRPLWLLALHPRPRARPRHPAPRRLTKLHVFKSGEPGLEHGQVFELLFNRERGYWLKPTVDPEERAARLAVVAAAATEWISEHPGQSTNKVKQGVARDQKCSSDLVEEALDRQVKSGLLPAPVKGRRNAKLWYPLNHAGLTSPETLLGEVSEGGQNGQNEDHFTRPPDFPVGESESSGEVVEAEPDYDELRETAS